MDIKSVNPSAHSDQEEFPIGDGKFLRLPTVAKGQSVTAAARKLTRGVDFGDGIVLSVPEPEAMAIATAVVDPTQLRLDIERRRVSLHLTPSGETLVSVQGRVWSAGASADGANGRGRLEAKLAGRAVWPLPVDGDGKPSMRYVTRDIDRMREAVRDNAARIANSDLNMRVQEHPHGVWNPVFLVPGRAVVQPEADGDIETESAFVHTAEGSTRLVTCQAGIGLDRDLPLGFAGNTLDLVRRARAGIAQRLALSPTAEDVHHAVKVASLPAHIIIGVLGPDGLPSTTAFPEVISEFVQSIHEEPRPWNALAQGGVRGERLVLDLAEQGYIPKDVAADIIGRDEHHQVASSPDVIAGRLLRATSHPDARESVRHAVLEDPNRQQLTRKRYAQTVGPLLLTIYRDTQDKQKNAVAALTQEFQPAQLEGRDWSVHPEQTVGDLLVEALAYLEDHPTTWSPAARELCARSLGGLAQLGLVYSDQGSQVSEAWMRGSVAKVLNGLVLCPGGLKILCEAAEKAEDRGNLMPILYHPDGKPVLGEDGQPVHLHPDQNANVRLRELAFRDNRPADDDDEEGDEDASPHDKFIEAQRRAAGMTAQLKQFVDELFEVHDADGQPLIDKYGLDRAIVGTVPASLSNIRDNILISIADEPEVLDEEDDHQAIEALEAALVGAGQDGSAENSDAPETGEV
jgi:hypothetical protein